MSRRPGVGAQRRSGFRGIGGGAPAPTISISGTIDIGETLTATASGGTLQWYRGGVAIGGETATTYTVAAADIRVTSANITCRATTAGGTTESNALAAAPDTYLPNSAVFLPILADFSLAVGDTLVQQWVARCGGKKAAVTLAAPADTNRPAWSAAGGPGSRPMVVFDGVDNVLNATVTMGAPWASFRVDVCGLLAGAETLGDRIARYAPASNQIEFGVTAAPVLRLSTAGTGGAVTAGTTTVTTTHRQMTYNGFSGASGSQGVSINNGADEGTSAITHAAWADGAVFSLGAQSTGATPTGLSCVGAGLHFGTSEALPLSVAQRAYLRALLVNECGV